MAGRIDVRRNDVKQRRRTLRQTLLDERRQTGPADSNPVKDDKKGRPVRTRAEASKIEAAQTLQDRKARQARTAREVKKVRPPFNNYIRVKHTGLSPFKSFQDASKRSRVAAWRAPPPNVEAPPPVVPKSVKAKQPTFPSQLPVPTIKKAGVVQFGAGFRSGYETFKPPAKIQPIPVATSRSVRTQPPKVETGKERIAAKPAKTRNIPPKLQPTKNPVPIAPAKKPVVSQPSKPQIIIPTKPRGLKKAVVIGNDVEIKNQPKRASRIRIEPSTRVLRSSRVCHQEDKENIQLRVATKVSSKRSAEKVVVHTAEVSTERNDRTKELQERSEQLAKETDRLQKMAEDWSLLKSQLASQLPSHVVDEIDAVTGQTILLTTKKFVQYKGLIDGAHTNPKITLEDLDGFWEMVYIQVRQLDEKYKFLSALKEDNWKTKSPNLFRNVQRRNGKRSTPTKKFSTPVFLRPADSPLLNMSVDELESSFVDALSGSFKLTPKVIDNAKRASRSRRFSYTMMQLSSNPIDAS